MDALEPKRFAPLNIAEVIAIAGELQALVGSQLQEVVQSKNEVGLGFYHGRKSVWLWIDLHPQRPVIVRVEGAPPKRKKVSRPLTLFLKSRFTGRRVESIRADLSRGRVLVVSFHRAKSEGTSLPIEIDVLLMPHAANVIARDGKSSIAEQKPKELPASALTDPAEFDVRPWSEIEAHWTRLQQRSADAGGGALGSQEKERQETEKTWKRALDKKETGLVRMREELAEKTSGIHRLVGDWLKENGNLEVPAKWAKLIDTEKSVAWNIEESFRRAKENERKAEGTRARIAVVEAEFEKLKAAGPSKGASKVASDQKDKQNSLLAKADAKGRRHQIGDLDVFIGKSAADNLAILRKAQSFDYWLHLRDQPGSHAIMRRTKNRIVTDAEFIEAGKWVIEQSLGKRANDLKGERHDLLIVECRFVRPIKGDKLGRVNYTNDRVLSVRL